MVGDGNQCILRPPLEPVHCTARKQTREFQGPCPKFLANLKVNNSLAFLSFLRHYILQTNENF
jgi:hypothetical protein